MCTAGNQQVTRIFTDSAIILVRVPTPQDGRMRPKHVVEEYVENKYMNKNIAFGKVIRLIYRRLKYYSETH
jgi:hypothetical protein